MVLEGLGVRCRPRRLAAGSLGFFGREVQFDLDTVNRFAQEQLIQGLVMGLPFIEFDIACLEPGNEILDAFAVKTNMVDPARS